MTGSSRGRLRVGTRGSRLALWQARHVAERLAALDDAPEPEIVEIRTTGDRIVELPLSEIGGTAFFTREIERALLDGEVDAAVHSLKDLPTALPEGLALGAVLPREDPRDAVVSRGDLALDALPAGARVGTSSLRRRALVAHLRPDLELAHLRGNVPTRVGKLDAGELDAVVLAAAGLRRLGLQGRIAEALSPRRFPPAVAQGAVAVQVRAGDAATMAVAARLDDPASRRAVTAERALLRRLEGGCQAPIGALAEVVAGERLRLAAVVSSLDGGRRVEGEREGPAEEAEELGIALAEEMLGRGGAAIMAEIERRAREAR